MIVEFKESQATFEVEIDCGDMGFQWGEMSCEFSTDGNVYKLGSYEIYLLLDGNKIKVTSHVSEFVVDDLFEQYIVN